jgi:hypothetical protein
MLMLADLDDLAAVTADGLPYDWASTIETADRRRGRIAADLQTIWRAVTGHTAARPLAHRAARARLHPAVQIIVLAAALKSAVAIAGLLFGRAQDLRLSLIYGLLLVVIAGSGAVLLYGGVRDLRARHLGGVLLLLGGTFANRSILDLARGLTGAFGTSVRGLSALPLEAFIPTLLWLFVRDFPAVAAAPRAERFFRRIVWASVVIGLALMTVNVAGFLINRAGGPTPAWVTLFDRNAPGRSFFWLIVFVLAMPALPVMIRRARAARHEERTRVKYFVTGLATGLVPSVAILALASAGSPVRPLLVRHFWLVGLVLYTSLLLVPIITAWAVLIERVMRIELVIRKGLQYALARTTLLLLAAAPVAALTIHFYSHRLSTVAEAMSGTAPLFLTSAVLLVIALTRTRERLLAAVDRRLFRERNEPCLPHLVSVAVRRRVCATWPRFSVQRSTGHFTLSARACSLRMHASLSSFLRLAQRARCRWMRGLRGRYRRPTKLSCWTWMSQPGSDGYCPMPSRNGWPTWAYACSCRCWLQVEHSSE